MTTHGHLGDLKQKTPNAWNCEDMCRRVFITTKLKSQISPYNQKTKGRETHNFPRLSNHTIGHGIMTHLVLKMPSGGQFQKTAQSWTSTRVAIVDAPARAAAQWSEGTFWGVRRRHRRIYKACQCYIEYEYNGAIVMQCSAAVWCHTSSLHRDRSRSFIINVRVDFFPGGGRVLRFPKKTAGGFHFGGVFERTCPFECVGWRG